MESPAKHGPHVQDLRIRPLPAQGPGPRSEHRTKSYGTWDLCLKLAYQLLASTMYTLELNLLSCPFVGAVG